MNTIESHRYCVTCRGRRLHIRNVHSPVADIIMCLLVIGFLIILLRPPTYWHCRDCGTRWDALRVADRRLTS